VRKIFTLLLVLLFWSIFIFHFSYWENSASWKLEKCIKANKNWTTRTLSEAEWFICIESTSTGEIISQIIFDEEFSKIDDEIDKYLINLEEDKDKYFWPDADSNYIVASDEIEKKFSVYWEYWNEYKEICWTNIIWKIMEYQEWELWIINASNFFEETVCMQMANLKLYIYRQVAYDILMLNKLSVREDSAKEHMQLERAAYDTLLNDMMINAWYMERISKKWPSVTQNTY